MTNAEGTKTVTVKWEVRFHEECEVPDDWVWDGDLSSLLELTDMPFGHPSGDLFDWGVG